MTTAQKNRFKKILEAKRNELLGEILIQRARLAIIPASDPMDELKSVAERDFAVKSMNQMTRLLRLVEGALGELRAGTFGICADCSIEIPLKRLEAVPWSPYCVRCQERAERSQKQGSRSDYDTPYALAS